MSAELRDHYDRMASFYEFSDWWLERFRYSVLRPKVWSYARGRTLELGVGTGLNIPYYHKGLAVVGIDISQGMLSRARIRAQRLGASIELRQMDATSLTFPSASFDTAVSTFLFCVLPNEVQPHALAEVHRVLKPGGRLVLLEYVYSQRWWRRLFMRMMAPYVRWLYRAGFDRRTAEFLQGGGWTIEQDQFVYADIIRLLVVRRSG